MGYLGDIIYSTLSSKEKIERYQQIIRDSEWEWLKKEIPPQSKLLDVGCGAGYAMQKATEDLGCNCVGIDPNPGEHGVGRYLKNTVKTETILRGSAENIPFTDQSFGIVFSSHVLEHVENEQKALQEMKRVLHDDGVLIIGMPTAMMASINLFSQVLFTTHIRIYEFFRFLFRKEFSDKLSSLFLIRSHSYPRAKTIRYDLMHYSVNNWKKIVSAEFEIVKTIEPCLYPFPDFPQLFKIHHSKLGASSVFFICKKK